MSTASPIPAMRPPLLANQLPLARQALIEQLNRHSATRISFKNAIHQAHASEILVRLTHYPGALRLTLSDDGCGLPNADPRQTIQQAVAGGHFGLAGMHERATMIGATLEVQRARDYGTAIILTVPLATNQT